MFYMLKHSKAFFGHHNKRNESHRLFTFKNMLQKAHAIARGFWHVCGAVLTRFWTAYVFPPPPDSIWAHGGNSGDRMWRRKNVAIQQTSVLSRIVPL